MIVEIFSKPDCGWCNRAKELLVRYPEFEVKEFTLGVDITKEELLERVPGARTVPQIFINGRYIGGYEKLDEYLKTEYAVQAS
jgi:glutaredoxin